ncbi:MAG: hypothetical protein EA377_09140 [Phycisphaerales bacterium]|nr:MAG: hypothetical protein EA377_09140 [Phycisphaerales bacterium]
MRLIMILPLNAASTAKCDDLHEGRIVRDHPSPAGPLLDRRSRESHDCIMPDDRHHGSPNHPERFIIGAMTGTSLDGIDLALVRVTGEGLSLQVELVQHHSAPLGDLAAPLRELAQQQPATAGTIATLALRFGERHAHVIRELITLAGRRPDLIVLHGQTVFHQPPVSWQLINPALIAAEGDCPIVFDLRQADLAAGGQGAPITPLADWVLFRSRERRRAIVNLGGFCNVTHLPAAASTASICDIEAHDLCVCNQLLDAIAQRAFDSPYDPDGQNAASGRTISTLVDDLHAQLKAQNAGGRSLGTGDELSSWLDSIEDDVAGCDLAASAAHAIGKTIAEAIRDRTDEIVLAGGGTRHRPLVQAIRDHASMHVTSTETFGIPVSAREAVAMAVLGALCADGMPITLPQVTGCRTPAPVAGVWLHPRATPR